MPPPSAKRTLTVRVIAGAQRQAHGTTARTLTQGCEGDYIPSSLAGIEDESVVFIVALPAGKSRERRGILQLWRDPVHGDNVLGASVLKQQRRSARREAKPKAVTARGAELPQAGYFLDLSVPDTNS